jgi:ABC-type spermidine/putrescine transport system permease subunit II
MSSPEPERWSQRWIAEQQRERAKHGGRLVGAVLLPCIAALFSVEAAFVLGVPCAYVAWKELKAVWPYL